MEINTVLQNPDQINPDRILKYTTIRIWISSLNDNSFSAVYCSVAEPEPPYFGWRKSHPAEGTGMAPATTMTKIFSLHFI